MQVSPMFSIYNAQSWGVFRDKKEGILKTQQYQWFVASERVDTKRNSYKKITAAFTLCKPLDCHGGFKALKRCARKG